MIIKIIFAIVLTIAATLRFLEHSAQNKVGRLALDVAEFLFTVYMII